MKFFKETSSVKSKDSVQNGVNSSSISSVSNEQMTDIFNYISDLQTYLQYTLLSAALPIALQEAICQTHMQAELK